MAYQSRLELSVDSRTGERNLRRFRGELSQTEQRGRSAFGNLRGLALGFAGALGAIGVTTGIRNSISTVADFQAAMNGLAAVSGATADQMASLEGQARTLGATSQFSAQQAAEAQRFLAQAGFEVNEVLGSTPGILQLATAGSLDLASAADIASNVLGGMRLEVTELGRVNDVLAATAARSNTSIEQLGQALSFAAPFAAGAGISIEEASAAIGVMSDSGIQASRAGTGLVGVIRQLSRVTPQAERALDAAGLSVADVNIEALGLQTVLANLAQANLDTGQAIEIFGSEAGAAAQVLVNDYTGAIEGATGEAERMASQMDQGLLPAFRGLGSAVSEATLQMGDTGLAGGLETLVRTATGVVSSINGMSHEFNAANGITERHDAVIQTLTSSLQVLAALAAGRLTVSLGAATMALGAKTAAAVAANGAVVTLTRSLALLGGPAGILIAAGTAAYLFRDSINSTSRAANRAKQEIDNLTASINLNSEASIRSGIADLERKLVAVQAEAAQASAELDQARLEMTDQAADAARGAGQTFNRAKAKADEYRGAISGLQGELEQLTAQEDRLAEVRALGITATEGLDDSTKQLTTSIGSLAAGSSDAVREAEQLERSYRSLIDQLYPLEAQQREYNRALELLDAAKAAGELDDLADAQRRLREQSAGDTMSGMTAPPGFGGIDGTVGGSMGEMSRIARQREELEEWHRTQIEMLSEFRERRAELNEHWDARERQIHAQHQDQVLQLERARQQAQLAAAESGFGHLADITRTFAGEQSGIYRAMFLMQKAAGIAQSIIAIQQGIAMAAANPWPINLAAMASVAGATAGLVSNIQAVTMPQGMAHDGIDRIPREGTWLLDRGERVMNRPQADRLDDYLDRQQGKDRQRDGARVTVNLIEDAERAGSVEQESMDDEEIINVFVANIASGGDAARAIEATYGVSRQGR